MYMSDLQKKLKFIEDAINREIFTNNYHGLDVTENLFTSPIYADAFNDIELRQPHTFFGKLQEINTGIHCLLVLCKSKGVTDYLATICESLLTNWSTSNENHFQIIWIL